MNLQFAVIVWGCFSIFVLVDCVEERILDYRYQVCVGPLDHVFMAWPSDAQFLMVYQRATAVVSVDPLDSAVRQEDMSIRDS